MEKISSICFKISMTGIIVCMFAGGLTLAGYIMGIFIGGSWAEGLCIWISDSYLPVVIRLTAGFCGIGLIAMYFSKHNHHEIASASKTEFHA